MQPELPLQPALVKIEPKIAAQCYGVPYIWSYETFVICMQCGTGKELLITPHRWDCRNCGNWGNHPSSFYAHQHD